MEPTASLGAHSGYSEASWNREAHASGVSWGAVIAGAFVAAALSLTLLALGAGFGLLSASPWSSGGRSRSAVDAAAIVWLIVIQIIASGAGGYLAGRLRTKWAAIHGDEVHFRDTAHGFLTWAVAVVITAAFLGSAAAAMVGSPGNIAEMRAQENDYFVSALFRSTPGATAQPVNPVEDAALRDEAAVVLANALRQPEIPATDRSYLAQLVSARTGMNENDAAPRVSNVVTEARQRADTMRKATARMLLWTFLSLLIGAFCASLAATAGGRQRDHLKAL